MTTTYDQLVIGTRWATPATTDLIKVHSPTISASSATPRKHPSPTPTPRCMPPAGPSTRAAGRG